MKKRHLQNCLSKEKVAFESEIKKYKSLVIGEISERVGKNLQKAREVFDVVPSTSTGFVGSELMLGELESDSSDSASGDSFNPEVSVLGTNNVEAEAGPVFEHESYCFRDNIGRKNQRVLPRTFFSIPKEPEKSEELLATLQKILKGQEAILEGQKYFNDRLKKVEENQINILANQGYLSNGQATLATNQENIAGKLERCETNHFSKDEFEAQNKILMECKVSIRKVEQSVCRMTGENVDQAINEVGSMLPLKTLKEVDSIEEKLQSPDFAMATKTLIFKTKGMAEDASEVIRTLMTDELMDEFNWEGRWGKRALANLTLFNKILRDAFSKQTAVEFERALRKAVDKSHHRQKQKIYSNKNKEKK